MTHLQILDGALAGCCVLCPEAEVGNHGEAAVGDLVLLVLLVHGLVTAGEADGVEELATCINNHNRQAQPHVWVLLVKGALKTLSPWCTWVTGWVQGLTPLTSLGSLGTSWFADHLPATRLKPTLCTLIHNNLVQK